MENTVCPLLKVYTFCVFQITKKLAGTAKGTAVWMSSVGNEFGEILISVLTAQEGPGLDQMANDLVKRYEACLLI